MKEGFKAKRIILFILALLSLAGAFFVWIGLGAFLCALVVLIASFKISYEGKILKYATRLLCIAAMLVALVGHGLLIYSAWHAADAVSEPVVENDSRPQVSNSFDAGNILDTLSAHVDEAGGDIGKSYFYCSGKIDEPEIVYYSEYHDLGVICLAGESVTTEADLKEISDMGIGSIEVAFIVPPMTYCSINDVPFSELGGFSDSVSQRDWQYQRYLESLKDSGFVVVPYQVMLNGRPYAALVVTPVDKSYGTCQLFVPGTDQTTAVITVTAATEADILNCLSQHFTTWTALRQ